jgi:hypothetical protein
LFLGFSAVAGSVQVLTFCGNCSYIVGLPVIEKHFPQKQYFICKDGRAVLIDELQNQKKILTNRARNVYYVKNCMK